MNNRVLTYGILIYGMQLTMFGSLIKEMSHSFQLTFSQMGSFFTVSTADHAIAIIFGGIISDRIGKKRVVIWAGFDFTVTLCCFPIS